MFFAQKMQKRHCFANLFKILKFYFITNMSRKTDFRPSDIFIFGLVKFVGGSSKLIPTTLNS